MAEKGEGRSVRALKEAAGLMAVLAAHKFSDMPVERLPLFYN